jgi:long-chain acyl-CoA synthetase
MNMSRMISWAARRHADRTAFIFNHQCSTYREIDDRCTRLAHALHEIGIVKGDRIAILVGNRPEYPESEFAVAKIGAVRVPFLVQSSAAELGRWILATECRAVIASPEAIDKLRTARREIGFPFAIIAIEEALADEYDYESLIAAAPDSPVDVDIKADDPYAIRFTGGTTGTPKGVVMSHRNMVAVVVNTVLNWPIDGTDVGLHIHPLSHAAGMMMYAYWSVGALNIIRPAFRFDPVDFAAAVERHRVTSVFIIPTILNMLLDSPAVQSSDLSSIRTIVYGGAPIPLARLEQGLERFGPVFLQVYGTSEAPFALTTLHREEHLPVNGKGPPWLRSAGREILNAEVRVVDDAGRPAPTGTVGEVAARGDFTMMGYWNNPELTAKRVIDGWVRTGDMGYLDADGYLYIVDRKDDLIITGGFNVWPTEIEDVLCRHPAVREAAIFGVQNEKWGEAVTAAVVLRDGDPTTEADILAFLAERLSKYKVPKQVMLRTEPIPKSPIGKPLRRRVREEFLDARRKEN